MIIGFDLDGVIASIDIPLFRLADKMGESTEIYRWNFRTAKRILNPIDFLVFSDDEYYIITSRLKEGEDITRLWVKKYCPHCKELIILDDGVPSKDANEKEVYEWLDRMAISKAEVIKKYKIEVYIEDSSYIVKRLRELCPDCKIINYGGRI